MCLSVHNPTANHLWSGLGFVNFVILRSVDKIVVLVVCLLSSVPFSLPFSNSNHLISYRCRPCFFPRAICLAFRIDLNRTNYSTCVHLFFTQIIANNGRTLIPQGTLTRCYMLYCCLGLSSIVIFWLFIFLLLYLSHTPQTKGSLLSRWADVYCRVTTEFFMVFKDQSDREPMDVYDLRTIAYAMDRSGECSKRTC